MSGFYFPSTFIPHDCMGCDYRDAEACGECMLMLCNPSRSFEEQYRLCPIKKISEKAIPVPDHGRLIDADALIAAHREVCFCSMKFNLDLAPTIIPADPAEEGE